MPWFAILSYGIAAIMYGATAVMLFASRQSNRRALLLGGANALSSLWAVGIVLLIHLNLAMPAVLVGLDALHLTVWTICVLSWLDSPYDKRWLIGASAAAGVLATVAAAGITDAEWLTPAAYTALLIMALMGFLAVEQVFRNARDEQRKTLRPLSLAAAGIFVIDVFVFSQGALFDGVQPILWNARGAANAALVPLVIYAIGRQPNWGSDVFVSRQVFFYTASLLGVGGYLLAMAIVSYAISALGGQWGPLFEVVFLVIAFGVLVVVLLSATIRARLRVFLLKNFERTKYDYRREWLELTQNLGRSGDLETLARNALEALARIVGSDQGDLWLTRTQQRYEWFCSLDQRIAPDAEFSGNHPVVLFLASNGWVIDSEEYAREPDRYGSLFGRPDEAVLPHKSLLVPLDCQGYLQGFAVLAKPGALRALNFEDHDILKTAGRQVAVVIAQAIAQEKLAETRQFEATSKLSMFLMHDLKNVVAQQELVVANAQRFAHRPEFIEDAVSTLRLGIDRMKKVLEQLNGASRGESRLRSDVLKIAMEVRSTCASREPVPELEAPGGSVWVAMDGAKLANLLTNVVRNAQDATEPTGHVRLRITPSEKHVTITVGDTGVGMDKAFVRSRLFRPFDSTKGAKGMGIGAYQVRETVRAAGGEVEVQSEPGVGTQFHVRLPLSQ